MVLKQLFLFEKNKNITKFSDLLYFHQLIEIFKTILKKNYLKLKYL